MVVADIARDPLHHRVELQVTGGFQRRPVERPGFGGEDDHALEAVLREEQITAQHRGNQHRQQDHEESHGEAAPPPQRRDQPEMEQQGQHGIPVTPGIFEQGQQRDVDQKNGGIGQEHGEGMPLHPILRALGGRRHAPLAHGHDPERADAGPFELPNVAMMIIVASPPGAWRCEGKSSVKLEQQASQSGVTQDCSMHVVMVGDENPNHQESGQNGKSGPDESAERQAGRHQGSDEQNE